MGLTMDQRKGYAREMAKRYRKASKKKKGQLIEEYLELTGCTRHHAAWLLRCWGTTVWDQRGGVRSRSWSASAEHGGVRHESTIRRWSPL